MMNYTGRMSHFELNGCYLQKVYCNGSNNQGSVELPQYSDAYRVVDCLYTGRIAERSFGSDQTAFFAGGHFPVKGIVLERTYWAGNIVSGTLFNTAIVWGAAGINYVGGDLVINDCWWGGLGNNAPLMNISGSPKCIYDGVRIEGMMTGTTAFVLGGTNCSYINIDIFGSWNNGLRIVGLVNPEFENITIANALNAVFYEGVCAGGYMKNYTVGAVANTNDFSFNTQVYVDTVVKTVTSNPIVNTTTIYAISAAAEGSQLAFENVNAANVDFVRQTYGDIYRTGAGLADTTVHTAGGYAMRFQPKSSVYDTFWRQNLPTGNIQGLTMSFGIWINIPNVAYWAGAHQMPRFTITFDNGADSEYVEAAQVTGWQFIQLAITPATTFGQITMEITGKTDAAGSNAYFYVDDFMACPLRR
jgi:hypothetical protein